MIVVNFSHPLTEPQLEQLAGLAGTAAERVLDVPCQFDNRQSFAGQARSLVDSVGLTAEEWQGLPLLVNLPSLSAIGAAVLAELHGRMGYFPSVLRLRPVAESVPPRFEVAEILNLQEMREESRATR